jgi:hypothetical protein
MQQMVNPIELCTLLQNNKKRCFTILSMKERKKVKKKNKSNEYVYNQIRKYEKKGGSNKYKTLL